MKRSDALFRLQTPFLSRWQDLAEIFDPEHMDFLSDRVDGDDPYVGLYTSEPQLLSRSLSQRVGSMSRPKGTDWFKLRAFPEEMMELQPNRQWCEKSTTTQRNVVYSPNAGFNRAMGEADSFYVNYGNAVLRHSYNRDRSGIYFSTPHLRDCAWAENAEGIVDEVHEKMRPTLDQAQELFGKNNLPAMWRKRLDDGKGHEKVEVRRCVAPMRPDEYEKGEKPRRGAKFVSYYLAIGDAKDDELCLAEGFFEVFPDSVRRWMTVPGSPYGRSCAAMALADGRTLNIAEQAALKGIEWTADPPKIAIDDFIIGQIELGAGKVTYVDAEYDQKTGSPIQNLEGGEPRTALEYIALKEQKMARAFFMDMLAFPMRDKAMTATEFMERLKIVLRDAAPVFEPIEADYAQLMDGVFERIRLAEGPDMPGKPAWGGFLPPPDELAGKQVRFEFQTALTEARIALKREQYMEVEAQHMRLTEAQSDARDFINLDKGVKSSLENFQSDWTRSDEEVESIRAQRAEQMAAQAQQEQAAAVADMAVRAKPESLRMLKQDVEEAA